MTLRSVTIEGVGVIRMHCGTRYFANLLQGVYIAERVVDVSPKINMARPEAFVAGAMATTAAALSLLLIIVGSSVQVDHV